MQPIFESYIALSDAFRNNLTEVHPLTVLRDQTWQEACARFPQSPSLIHKEYKEQMRLKNWLILSPLCTPSNLPKLGRPRVYATNSQRQAAYRLRKRQQHLFVTGSVS
jgi:hypothetical protein